MCFIEWHQGGDKSDNFNSMQTQELLKTQGKSLFWIKFCVFLQHFCHRFSFVNWYNSWVNRSGYFHRMFRMYWYLYSDIFLFAMFAMDFHNGDKSIQFSSTLEQNLLFSRIRGFFCNFTIRNTSPTLRTTIIKIN